jgi:hypothetical protein
MKRTSDDKEQRVYELVLKGNTFDEIGKVLDIDVSTVDAIIERRFPHLRDLAVYKEYKTDILQGLQQHAITHLLKKVPWMPGDKLTDLICKLEDRINLREGRSTSNVSIVMKMEHLIEEKAKREQDLKDAGIPEHRVEQALIEHCETVVSGASLPLQVYLEDSVVPSNLTQQFLV